MTTSPEALAFLWDARLAGEKIVRFTEGHTLDGYLADDLVRSAVERQFLIVGEALNGLRRSFPLLAGRIPDIDHIVAFRHRLVHAYATIDDRRVWAFV